MGRVHGLVNCTRRTALATALAFATPACGLDGVSLEIGQGESTEMLRLGAQWKWQRAWSARSGWEITGYWDVSAGIWNTPQGSNPADLALTPTFRLQPATPRSAAPYFEAAIGFHLLSDVRVTSRKVLGTHFQFGDHIGAGLRFGPRRRYDVSLRLQHLSNGGIRRPNPGINFAQLRFAYHF